MSEKETAFPVELPGTEVPAGPDGGVGEAGGDEDKERLGLSRQTTYVWYVEDTPDAREAWEQLLRERGELEENESFFEEPKTPRYFEPESEKTNGTNGEASIFFDLASEPDAVLTKELKEAFEGSADEVQDDELRRKLREQKALAEEAFNEISRLEDKIRSLTDTNQALESERKAFQTRIQSLETQVQVLGQELEQAEQAPAPDCVDAISLLEQIASGEAEADPAAIWKFLYERSKATK